MLGVLLQLDNEGGKKGKISVLLSNSINYARRGEIIKQIIFCFGKVFIASFHTYL